MLKLFRALNFFVVIGDYKIFLRTKIFQIIKHVKLHKQSHADLVQLADDEGSVVEGPNLLVALPVDNGHGLQAHCLHGRLGREQETVVEVVEKLQPVIPRQINERTRRHMTNKVGELTV